MNQVIQEPPRQIVPQREPPAPPVVIPPPPPTLIRAAPISKPPVHPLAVASAVCGIAAIVPVVSQIVAIVLGIIALRRIRRARRDGQALRGAGWAATGIASSLFMLLCWIVIFAVFIAVWGMFAHTTSVLEKVIPAHQS